MRSRFTQLAVLLLLLSSLAVTDARAGGPDLSRTPGGVFVRNLLLRAAVEEAEPAASEFGRERSAAVEVAVGVAPTVVRRVPDAAAHTAHVHAVTGSGL